MQGGDNDAILLEMKKKYMSKNNMLEKECASLKGEVKTLKAENSRLQTNESAQRRRQLAASRQEPGQTQYVQTVPPKVTVDFAPGQRKKRRGKQQQDHHDDDHHGRQQHQQHQHHLHVQIPLPYMSDGSFLERDSVSDGFSFASGPAVRESKRTQVIQANAEVQTKYVPYATASEEILMRRVQQLESILEEFGFQIPNRPFFLSREGYNNSDLLHVRHYFESGAVRPTKGAIGRLLKYHNSELSRLRQIEAKERWSFMAHEILLVYKERRAGVDYDSVLKGKEEKRRAE